MSPPLRNKNHHLLWAKRTQYYKIIGHGSDQVQITSTDRNKKKGQKQIVKSDEPTAVLNGVSPKNTYKQLTMAPNSNIMWKIEMIWQRLWWPSPQSKVPTIILKILSILKK